MLWQDDWGKIPESNPALAPDATPSPEPTPSSDATSTDHSEQLDSLSRLLAETESQDLVSYHQDPAHSQYEGRGFVGGWVSEPTPGYYPNIPVIEYSGDYRISWSPLSEDLHRYQSDQDQDSRCCASCHKCIAWTDECLDDLFTSEPTCFRCYTETDRIQKHRVKIRRMVEAETFSEKEWNAMMKKLLDLAAELDNPSGNDMNDSYECSDEIKQNTQGNRVLAGKLKTLLMLTHGPRSSGAQAAQVR